jgi:hypothetical protein
MKSIISLLAFSAIALAALPVSADQTLLRCGSELITISDTMYKVQEVCGAPAVKQNVGEKRIFVTTVDKQHELETVSYLSEWTYKRDGGLYVLTFEGSRLVKKEFVR